MDVKRNKHVAGGRLHCGGVGLWVDSTALWVYNFKILIDLSILLGLLSYYISFLSRYPTLFPPASFSVVNPVVFVSCEAPIGESSQHKLSDFSSHRGQPIVAQLPACHTVVMIGLRMRIQIC